MNVLKNSIAILCIGAMISASSLRAQVGKYGDDEMTCKTNISLYTESFKQWKATDYQNAEMIQHIVAPWRYCIQNCPMSREGLYLDGIAIMKYFANVEKDATLKEKYIDTIAMLFDMRAEYFPMSKGKSQIGNIMWRKAAELFVVAPERIETIYEAAKKSIDIDEADANENAVIYFFSATIGMTAANKAEKVLIVENYDRLSVIIEGKIKKYLAAEDQKMLEKWYGIRTQIEQQFEPFASCEDLISIFQPKFDQNPNDLETLKKITSTLDKNKCTDSDLFLHATQNLYKLEPTIEAAYLMAKIYIRNTEYEKAHQSLIDVIEMNNENESEDNLQLEADAELLLSQVCLHQNKLSSGREHARNSLKFRPNDGRPLMLIGDLYAASSNVCDEDEIAKKAVFWAAVDKYSEAKRIDPSIADECDKKISLYRQYFPTSERAFFHDYTDGMSYRVGCWINENTTVRTIK
ncbi:MAG: hypothetical protein PHR53_06055 [Bacteroidales bacterium]|nr:hypothetical protein [Bacteroidales bacterium]